MPPKTEGNATTLREKQSKRCARKYQDARSPSIRVVKRPALTCLVAHTLFARSFEISVVLIPSSLRLLVVAKQVADVAVTHHEAKQACKILFLTERRSARCCLTWLECEDVLSREDVGNAANPAEALFRVFL